MTNETLFPLFRDELLSHARTLRQHFEAVPAGGAPRLTAAGVHAVASLRGAARVVGSTEVERLVAALEACCARPGPLAEELRVLLFEALEALSCMGLAADVAAARSLAGEVQRLAESLEQSQAPPEPAPAAPAAGGLAGVGPDLGDLFRLECETHSSTLVDALLQLERMPGEMRLLDKLMRATHSLKGAARVVGLDGVVKLAHEIEERISRARREQRELTDGAVEVLLEAADVFVRLGQPGAAPEPSELSRMLARVRALDAGAPAGAALPARVPEPRAAPAAEPVAAPEPLVEPMRAGALQEGDRVLRVRASQISQMVGLAGEALVESRRLRPLAQAQHRLRSRQSSLADLLSELHQALGAPPIDDPIGVRIAELLQRVAECRSMLGRWEEEFEQHARRSEDLTLRLHREATLSRMRPLSDGLTAFPRLVRDLSRRLNKQVDFTVTGAEVPIDRDILEKIEAPLNHVLRNALDHGLEAPEERERAGKPARGSLRLEARHHAGTLRLTISDDGRGISTSLIRTRIVRQGLLPEAEAAQVDENKLYDYLFVPGFSTSDVVTELSGRGVGMDVVQSVMHELGGSVHLSSEVGRGTSIELTLPVSRSVIRAVVVNIAGAPYAFPLSRLDRLLESSRAELRLVNDRQYVLVDGQSVALVPTAQILELPQQAPGSELLSVVVVSSRTHRFGFVVDAFLGEHDLVVRPLDPRLGRISDISAAAILADGSPVLIVDVDDLIRSVIRLQEVTRIEKLAPPGARPAIRSKRILIVDDSVSVRELERRLLVDRGYEVEVAVDGVAGWSAVRDGAFDLAIVDVDMPRIDGFALTRSIKQDSRLRSLPVFMISYRDSNEDRAQAFEAGASDYMTKADFQNQAFLRAVERLIGEPTIAVVEAP